MKHIAINHAGYRPGLPKRAVFICPEAFTIKQARIIDLAGAVVAPVTSGGAQKVARWYSGWHAELAFDGFDREGTWILEVESDQGNLRSWPFAIGPLALKHPLLSDILYYFKGQRASGPWDRADRTAPFVGARRGVADVHGGWYDASGDYSKYLSHLSYAHFMNPQQIPLVVWNLAEARGRLEAEDDLRYTAQVKRIDEEAAHGADFLVRMQDEAGYFYMTVFDRWSKDTKQREICSYETNRGFKFDTYQSAWRQGGGMAVAALARVGAQDNRWGEYGPQDYLRAAAKGFTHLMAHGTAYTSDGKENIIDDYCALLAAVELRAASVGLDANARLVLGIDSPEVYADHARTRARALLNRISSGHGYEGWLRADDQGERPFFHASDAGLPLVALMRHAVVETDGDEIARAWEGINRIAAHQLDITAAVDNPFGLARQLVKPLDGPVRDAFFFPHTNESGYWWQGENARLASLSTAFLMIWRHPQGLPARKAEALAFAVRQIDWILGANPFDLCMVHGTGRNNPEYVAAYANAPGGVCNGITSGFDDEDDIAFQPVPQRDDPAQNWRWGEQWIPHGAWLFLALAWL